MARPGSRSGFFATGLTPESPAWSPPVDVYRIADGWLLKFELAGVDPDDIAVELQGRRVIVRGTRLDRGVEAGCSVHRMEIAYNWFERAIELPEDLSAFMLGSEYSHGMLLLRLTRNPAP